MSDAWDDADWQEYYDMWYNMKDNKSKKPDLCPLTGIEVGTKWGIEKSYKQPIYAVGVITKCECGKDASGDHGLHSDWCAKSK